MAEVDYKLLFHIIENDFYYKKTDLGQQEKVKIQTVIYTETMKYGLMRRIKQTLTLLLRISRFLFLCG